MEKKPEDQVKAIWPPTNWMDLALMGGRTINPANIIIYNTDKNTVTSYPATLFFSHMEPGIGIRTLYSL